MSGDAPERESKTEEATPRKLEQAREKGDGVKTMDLGSFATTYAGGYPGKAGGTAWAQNDTVDYRFTITQNDDATANAHTAVKSSGAHDFTWEARNN